jgi:hypothetical protein
VRQRPAGTAACCPGLNCRADVAGSAVAHRCRGAAAGPSAIQAGSDTYATPRRPLCRPGLNCPKSDAPRTLMLITTTRKCAALPGRTLRHHDDPRAPGVAVPGPRVETCGPSDNSGRERHLCERHRPRRSPGLSYRKRGGPSVRPASVRGPLRRLARRARHASQAPFCPRRAVHAGTAHCFPLGTAIPSRPELSERLLAAAGRDRRAPTERKGAEREREGERELQLQQGERHWEREWQEGGRSGSGSRQQGERQQVRQRTSQPASGTSIQDGRGVHPFSAAVSGGPLASRPELSEAGAAPATE